MFSAPSVMCVCAEGANLCFCICSPASTGKPFLVWPAEDLHAQSPSSMKEEVMQKSKHHWQRVGYRLVGKGWVRELLGWGGGCVATSRRYTENHYGDSNQGAQGSEPWSERKAWEAADWGISPHSGWFDWQLPLQPPHPRALPDQPSPETAGFTEQNRDVASSPFIRKTKIGIEANTAHITATLLTIPTHTHTSCSWWKCKEKTW